MEYIDEAIVESRKKLERQQHTTLENGIYVDDELITFLRITLPDSKISMLLPEQFIVMPESVKLMKYPSKDAPEWILTSLDSTVNWCFSILEIESKNSNANEICSQFQMALRNVNPSIKASEQTEVVTNEGDAMSWFEFVGYTLDGQNYNRIYIVKMKDTVLHGTFNCSLKDKIKWENIVELCFLSIDEMGTIKG
ncbi:hypothetical protein [Lacrimispora brassicae]